MSDTRIENAIVEAIDIIAEKKVASANYDKTVIATIKEVVDKTLGKYQVKQQDSIYQAYSTSPNIVYEEGQRVSVLISGNDRDRSKIIIGGVKSLATNYKSIPVASEQCNIIGPSGVSLNQVMQLSSYKDTEGEGINGNFSDIQRYVQQGNSILLGMTVRTNFASSQTGGRYGLNFYLKFKDEKGERITCYPLDSTSVIGNPYGLTKETPVQALFRDVDTKNFVGIEKIQAFCNGFPEDENKIDIKDIFISDIRINGASALTQKQLSNMILHIDCSKNGSQLNKDVPKVLLKAELKINGVVTTENVQYFWFRQNGLVFKGSIGKYSSHAGGGWECVNFFGETSHIPYNTNQFTFTSKGDDFKNKIALANQKVTKVLCVAVLEEKTQISSQIEILNTNLGDVEIVSSDLTDNKENQVNYYLGLGSPDLTCIVKDEKGNQITENLKYTWSVKPSRGNAVLKEEDSEFNERYAAAVQTWKQTEQKAALVPAADLDKFKTEKNYDNILKEYQAVINQDFVDGNTYHNFPINSIIGSTTISCAVEKIEESEDGQTSTYLGTASITLYNKTQLEGMYSLNMEYGTQVFQYDNKGNSPASKQVDKPITIHPLDFKLINNEGKQVTYQSIIFEGWVKWIIPTSQTLLKSAQEGESQSGDTDVTVNSADLPLPASDYKVYTNIPTFAYSIDDRYDSKKNVNYIWLVVKYQDIILSAYTNFTFPKDGDPGTNGTDIVAKITTQNGSDRLYIRSTSPNEMFDDTGAIVQQLDFQLYNNSIKVDSNASLWTCLASGKNAKTYLDSESSWQVPFLDTSKIINIKIDNIKSDQPVNIIRAQYNAENNLKYYAEYPICTEFISQEKQQYRIRIKPKTGFKYVVYAEDGTRPDYDNTLPFELILEEYVGAAYWIGIQAKDMPAITWDVIGNLEIINTDNNKCEVKPKDNFDGSDLSSAVITNVEGIGFIHIPIYTILNRYGHSALNKWDGNSIQLDADNKSMILAPQVGAGKKNDKSNTFTGIVIGTQKNTDKEQPAEETGLLGYDKGVRSIFLDAETGNATFGKPGAGQIKIVASSGQGTIESGDYNQSNKTGMKIKFSSDGDGPYIKYGSGHFSVDKNGNITAQGNGKIAGWNIDYDKIFKHNDYNNCNWAGIASDNWTVDNINGTLPNKTDTVAFYAGGYKYFKTSDKDIVDNKNYYILNESNNKYEKVNEPKKDQIKKYYEKNDNYNHNNFYVTHNGYLFSKQGNIAGWQIDPQKISKEVSFTINQSSKTARTGMNSNPNTTDTYYALPSAETQSDIRVGNLARAFRAGYDSAHLFYVTHDGYLYSSAGKIGGWTIAPEVLANGNVGLGTFVTGIDALSGDGGGKVTAKIWSGTGTTPNFAVSNKGYIYSKAGKIGGWTIEPNQLKAKNIEMTSGGSIRARIDNEDKWSINSDGTASFKAIQINGGGITLNTINKGTEKVTTFQLGTKGNVYNYTVTQNTDGTRSDTGYITAANTQIYPSAGATPVGLPKYITDLAVGTLTANTIIAKLAQAELSNIKTLLISPTKTGLTITMGPGGITLHRGDLSVQGSDGQVHPGRTGLLTFSDGSSIGITKGIITSVTAPSGADATWTPNDGRG